MTVAAWVKISQTIASGTIASKSSLSPDGVRFWFFEYNGGLLRAGIIRSFDWVIVDGTVSIADGQWLHVAFTVFTNGATLYVDGVLDAQGVGPLGDLSYRDGRATAWPDSDPLLVLGAEKHDAGAAYPSHNGWLDELRISTVVRYTNSFARPAAAFAPDANTAALYHLDEGAGEVIGDSAFGAASPGVRRFGGGGTPGPAWSEESPFGTPIPVLGISAIGAGEVTISWTPNTGANWVLQERTNLSLGTWTNSPSGANNPVTVPATLPTKFNRLFKP